MTRNSDFERPHMSHPFRFLPCDFWDKDFPDGWADKESACSAGDMGLIPGSGRSPEGRSGSSIPVFSSENSNGQRSLTGLSPKGYKSQTWLGTHTHTLLGKTHNQSSNLEMSLEQKWKKNKTKHWKQVEDKETHQKAVASIRIRDIWDLNEECI